MPTHQEQNLHCTVVQVDGLGVLLRGPSGSGKTSVAMGLIDTATCRGSKAFLVADDQVLAEQRNRRLFVKAPPATQGKVEVWGYGITKTNFIPEATVEVVCDLVDIHMIERMPKPETVELMGVRIPHLSLPKCHEQGSVRIVLAYLNDFVP